MLEDYKNLKEALENATTKKELLDLCEEYEYEIDFEYSEYTFEEMKKEFINSVVLHAKWLEEELEEKREQKRNAEEFKKYGNENAYYSALYGIPRN